MVLVVFLIKPIIISKLLAGFYFLVGNNVYLVVIEHYVAIGVAGVVYVLGQVAGHIPVDIPLIVKLKYVCAPNIMPGLGQRFSGIGAPCALFFAYLFTYIFYDLCSRSYFSLGKYALIMD